MKACCSSRSKKVYYPTFYIKEANKKKIENLKTTSRSLPEHSVYRNLHLPDGMQLKKKMEEDDRKEEKRPVDTSFF